MKDELTGNSNQLFSISTEDSATENGPKSLLEKMRLDIRKRILFKHWNEVSEQVVELTSLKYFKSRKGKYPSKIIHLKKLTIRSLLNIY